MESIKLLSHRIDMIEWEAKEKEASNHLMKYGSDEDVKEYLLSTSFLVPQPELDLKFKVEFPKLIK